MVFGWELVDEDGVFDGAMVWRWILGERFGILGLRVREMRR